MMDLQQAALATDGTAVGGNVAFVSVSTDSRAIQPGQLFVALRGERFDGHEFLAAVAAQKKQKAANTIRKREVPKSVPSRAAPRIHSCSSG